MLTHYAILEVSEIASNETIKAAYKALSKKHHPDMGGDENRMKEINFAFDILGDTSKRREYDRWLRGQRTPPPIEQKTPPSRKPTDHQPINTPPPVYYVPPTYSSTPTPTPEQQQYTKYMRYGIQLLIIVVASIMGWVITHPPTNKIPATEVPTQHTAQTTEEYTIQIPDDWQIKQPERNVLSATKNNLEIAITTRRQGNLAPAVVAIKYRDMLREDGNEVSTSRQRQAFISGVMWEVYSYRIQGQTPAVRLLFIHSTENMTYIVEGKIEPVTSEQALRDGLRQLTESIHTLQISTE